MALSKIDVANMLTGATPVANGGTGLASGTNGQFLKFTGSTTVASAAVDSSLTPSFSAYLDSSDQSISSDTYVKIIFNAEDHDSDSAYDVSTGRFTVPSGKGGRYVIGFMGSYDGASSSSVPWSTFTWYKNGSQKESFHSADYSATSRRVASVCDVIVDTMSAGDYFEVYAFHNKGSSAVLKSAKYKNHFWGYKIG